MNLQEESEGSKTVLTPFGELVKQDFGGGDTWEGVIEVNGQQVEVIADDVNDQPSPTLVNSLAFIIGNLPVLENKARQAIPELSDQHLFSLITESEGDSDFSLDFNYKDEDGGETVFIDFRGEEVVGWDRAD